MIATRDLSDWKNCNRLLVVNFIRILVEVETTFVFDAALMRMIFSPQLYPDSQHIFKMYLRHRNKKIPSWIIAIKPQLLLINQMKTLKWQPSQTVSESSWSLWRSPPPYLYIIKAWAEFWYFFFFFFFFRDLTPQNCPLVSQKNQATTPGCVENEAHSKYHSISAETSDVRCSLMKHLTQICVTPPPSPTPPPPFCYTTSISKSEKTGEKKVWPLCVS